MTAPQRLTDQQLAVLVEIAEHLPVRLRTRFLHGAVAVLRHQTRPLPELHRRLVAVARAVVCRSARRPSEAEELVDVISESAPAQPIAAAIDRLALGALSAGLDRA